MFDNSIAWYYQVWPWVGLGIAVVLLILLFATNLLRGDPARSRWKDPAWLAWLLTAGYLLHNVEEYGIDLTGTLFAFPATFAETVGTMPGAIFFASVNISLFWFAFPIASLLSRKYPMMTLGMAGLVFVNAIIHIAGSGGYNPGLLTGIVIFLPVALWTFYACLGTMRLKFAALLAAIVLGAISHGVLMGSVRLYAQGLFGDPAAAVIQVLNAVLAVLLWYAAGKIMGGKSSKLMR